MKRKTFPIFIIALLCAFMQNALGQNTYTIGWGSASGEAGTYTNFAETSGTVENVLSFTTDKNDAGTAPAYNSTNNELRLYYASTGNGGSITITPLQGVTITGAVITTSTEPSVAYSVDGGVAESVSHSDNSDNTYTYTISGISATSSLEIKNVNTSNTQLRIKTIAITYIPPTTYTVSFDSGEGTFFQNSDFQTTSNSKRAGTYTLPSAGRVGYHFDGWTTAGNATPVTGSYTVSGDVAFTASYSVSNERWVSTSLSDLTACDEFVIVCDNGNGHYAMSNDNGTSSAPAAVEVTIIYDELAYDVADNIKWNVIGNGQTGYYFMPVGSTDNLYCSNNNDGVRVGTNESNNLFILNNGYLKNTATERYIGVLKDNDHQEWRCYTSIDGNSNIAGQTFAFYKKVSDNTPTCCPIIIPLGNSWTENFENFEPSFTPKTSLQSTAVNDYKAFRMDDGCWDELMDNGERTVCNPALYTNYHMNALGGTESDNNASVQFYNRLGSDPCTLILPEFRNDLTTLQFSFKGCYYTTSGTLQIGYYHNGTFTSTTGAGFTITTGRNANPSTANYGPYTFPGAPSGSRIALRYTPVTNAGGINIDEFCVSHLDGLIFTTNGNWNVWNNWTPAGMPSSTTDVYIAATATIPVGYEAHYKSITIQEGGQLRAPYTLPVTVQKSISAAKWKAIASAVCDDGETHLNLAGNTNLTTGTYDLLAYDEASGTWVNQKAHNDFTLNRGQGYIYRCKANNTLTFEGKTTVDNVTITLTATDAAGDLKGFNLIGNPFPHKVMLDRAFYSLNSDGFWVEHPNGDSLLVGEAALVHVTSNEELTFYAATRTTNPGTKGYLPPLPKGFCLNGDCDDDLQDVQSTQSAFFAYIDGNDIIVNGKGILYVYDIMGRLLFKDDVSTYKPVNLSLFPSTGVYILRLGEKSQKIVIRK